jgi:hypothetical protein
VLGQDELLFAVGREAVVTFEPPVNALQPLTGIDRFYLGSVVAMSAANADLLRAAGLRVTAARLAILDAVGAGHHPGADEIAAAVRERIGQVSLQGVYEALAALATAGLIRRIEPAGDPARYEGPAGVVGGWTGGEPGGARGPCPRPPRRPGRRRLEQHRRWAPKLRR